MKSSIRPLLYLSSVLLTPAMLLAQTNRQSVDVTVYNNNLGVVREVRTFNIPKGTSEVKMQDVPSGIDPTTVKVTDDKHPDDIAVLEQNYEYDLVSQQKLLEKYLDERINVADDKGNHFDGILLAVEADKLTIQTPTGVVMLPDLSHYVITVPSLAGGLITKPTLIWSLDATQHFTDEPLDVLYQTSGMSWHAEYVATLSDDQTSMDLGGWVSIDNRSGGSFEDAKLKLVAGALNRVQPNQPVYAEYARGAAAAKPVPQFQERGLFEYHLYELPRPVTIKNNEVKQISLLEADGVRVKKLYTYTGGRNANVSITFQNAEANHLGMPLPEGIVRVMQRDKDGTFQFVGEDRIEHTPKDEKLTLKVGDAFDVIGERDVTDQHSIGPRSNEESVKVTLRNHKDEAISVDVVENVGTGWQVINSTIPFDKKDASTIVFHLPVKSNAEASVSYTIQHQW